MARNQEIPQWHIKLHFVQCGKVFQTAVITVSYACAELGENSLPAQFIALVP